MSVPVALVTCTAYPDLEDDDRLLIEPLAVAGYRAEPVVWDDPAVDWDAYALVVLRSTWDYTPRRHDFVTWASKVPRLANPAPVIAWNTDKRYLAELASSGVPVVPTTWVEPSDEWAIPADGHWVIKPSVSSGSQDTGRYDLGRADHRAQAGAHVRRLQAAGRTTMVQPYLEAVDSHGETALMFVGGEFSHAIRKGALLNGPDVGMTGLYKPESITAREPSPAERELAERALAAIPTHLGKLLYARIDVIPGPDGAPRVIEVELTEPSLFLGTAPGAPPRFAAAIAAAARMATSTAARTGISAAARTATSAAATGATTE